MSIGLKIGFIYLFEMISGKRFAFVKRETTGPLFRIMLQAPTTRHLPKAYRYAPGAKRNKQIKGDLKKKTLIKGVP